MVKGKPLDVVLVNNPTAVQLPADTHDTEVKIASRPGLGGWSPLANTAGVA
jgi:hypothetical protein